MQNKRVYIVITPEFDKKCIEWGKRLGISKGLLIAMSAQAGLDSIIRAVSPVDAFTPSQWAGIVKAMEEAGMTAELVKASKEMIKTGKPVILADGTVVGSEESEEELDTISG